MRHLQDPGKILAQVTRPQVREPRHVDRVPGVSFAWTSAPGTVTALYESAYEMLATQGMGTGDEPEVMRGPRPEDLLELYPEDLDVLA